MAAGPRPPRGSAGRGPAESEQADPHLDQGNITVSITCDSITDTLACIHPCQDVELAYLAGLFQAEQYTEAAR